MKTIQKHDTGPAVEDVQQRLAALGFLQDDHVSGTFDDLTLQALKDFCSAQKLPISEVVDDKVWVALVDATFLLGDRTLYLRMPYFHGSDVLELQHALSALGFACGSIDGIFGAHTELALRKFQLNLGLPSDGIAGALTFEALHNLEYSWSGKDVSPVTILGFARAADVLEHNTLCLFGTDEFTRSVASRMSNLALATNPASKILSADSLLDTPNEKMLLVHIVLPEEASGDQIPRVSFISEETLPLRVRTAINVTTIEPPRIALELPGKVWADAGAGRSAQHYAITLLDAICAALSQE